MGRTAQRSSIFAGASCSRTPPSPAFAQMTIARCSFRLHPRPGDPTDRPTDLTVIDPNGTEHVIASVVYDTPPGGSSLFRCSIGGNQAIVAVPELGVVVGPVWQVQLGTGRVRTPTWLPTANPLSALAVGQRRLRRNESVRASWDRHHQHRDRQGCRPRHRFTGRNLVGRSRRCRATRSRHRRYRLTIRCRQLAHPARRRREPKRRRRRT